MTRPGWSKPAHHLWSSGVSWRWPSTLARALGVCLLMWASCRLAAAQGSASLAGTWQAEPMTVRWVIGDWGAACGPRPSGGGDSGGVVTVEERGTELVISGSGRGYSTEQCWEMHPGLVRQSHSGSRRAWKTTCRTPPNDARQEILQTTITATDDVISFQETGQYQFLLQGQTCSASSGRWRTYRRGAAATQAPPPVVPEVPAELAPRPVVENPCKTPGAPARIEVRPSRKLMRAGESFQFRATVLDARGCVARAPVTWELSPPDAAATLDAGELSVKEGAADAELVVVATAASQSVRVSVDVVSNERYASLLASGDFDADGASAEAATATITSGSLGAQQVAGEPERSGRKWTFVGLVSVIALLFGAVGVWLVRRANRSAARARGRGNATLVEGGTVVFAADDAVGDAPRGLPDATRLEPLAPAPAPKASTVCPVCGTLYDAKELKACPKDGARLLPVNA